VVTQKSLGPLEKPLPLRQQVYDALEELIIYGNLSGGEHLVESHLAQRLGVSRIPVREALQLLHRDGWVDLRPRQGAFVHRPTLQEADEVFTVRTLLEVEATRLASRAPGDASVSDLKEIIKQGHEALRNDDDRELVRLNSSFHGLISQIAGNRVLKEMIARLDKRIRWYFAPVVKSRGSASWTEHSEITDAIEAGDADWAAKAMRSHAEATKAAFHADREGQRDQE
jgi:DNA-binding GntR family transcriptional regulator